jgi:hypothetical protein
MTVNDIPRFFEGREMPGRIMVYRSHNVILFKVDRVNLQEVESVFERLKPPFMRFLYKRLNWWDRFLLRKRKIRLELR